MKRIVKILLLAVCLIVSQLAFAQTVSESTARSRANAFFTKNTPKSAGTVRRTPAKQEPLTLAYTSQKDGKTCFYVYNKGENDGFVIIGGDEVAEQILAYSDHGHFDYATAPDNFKDMLNQYAEQISLAKPVANTQNAPSRVMRTAATPAVQKVDIPDLIQTTWDQWDPYNRAIPKLVNSNTGEEFAPPTGCVQTAVAQIMKYWNYPTQGIGQETRVLDYSQINAYSPGFTPYTPEFGTMVHNVDFASTTYDWANMLNNYTGQETEEQITAVSTLMYHVGVACLAVWGVNETTGANPADGLKTYFGYSPKATELNRDEFDDQTWEELIYTELALNRPVLYAGVGDNYTGHQFIVHGYSSQYDMYKVNWGWGGSMDCYCKLTPVSGSGSVLMGYENNQEAVIRLQPATMDSNTSLEYGDTFWYNDLKYSIISNVFKTVEVARPENSNWYGNGHITIPSTVSYQGISYSVIGIGDYAFSKSTNIETNYNLLSIEEVNLPDGIRKIGSFAFSSCEFTHISMPNTVSYLGLGCFHMSQVEEIVLPNLITTIPTYCFEYCQNLRNISLPNNLIKIGSYAFEGCNNLIKIILPSKFTEIEHGVFRECSNLEIFICESTTPPTISHPDVETPFSETVNTGVLLVPAASISQYQSATYWQDWKNIQPIETTDISMLGEEVTIEGIQYQLFPSGAQVNKVFESSSVITIPDEISVNDHVYPIVSIGNRAFDDVQCDTINLPQHLKTIKPNAFNAYVKHISLPDGVTSIAPYAFQGCYHLERISIPSTIEDIPDWCFNSCTNLHLVELSQNIKAISAAAFDGCKNLFTIICHATDVPEWEGSMMYFSNQVEGTLYVPNLSIQDYHTSEFGKNWRFIKPISIYDESDTLLVIERDRMSYRLLDHGAIFMGSRYNINEEHIVVPDTLVNNNESYNVISLGTGALSHTHSMSSISLPIALHSIMNNAFSGCDGLEEIHFPDSLKYIGGGAFWLSAIEKLVIPEGVVSIPIFFETSALKEVVIPSTVSMEIIRFDANVEKAYLMNPDNFSRVFDSYQTSVYVPNEYVAQYQNESNWQVKEVLPITPLTSITLAESNLSLTTGEIDSLVVNCAPANASLQYVKWISSDPTIASVNTDGVVTTHQAGTATITATSMYYLDLSDSCIVTVTPAMYQITFLNDNGTILQQDSIEFGVTPAYTGATPTKPATVQYTYTFKGWDKEIVAVVGAEIYTAQFDSIVNKYTITFVDEDGTTLQTSEIEYGQIPAYNGAPPTKQATAQYTYTFAGWSPEVVAVTGAATYTATYSSTANSYLITFVNYDGSTLQSGNVNYGVTPTYIGATPTKPATSQYTYTFKGWDKEIVSVVGVENYTAQFDSIVNKYTITFVDEDGTMLQTSEVEYGQVPAYNGASPTKPATAQYTYAFAGWTPEVIAVTGEATYTAQFTSTVNSYQVNGEYHDYGEEVTLTAEVPECKYFVSWSDGNTDNPRTITVTGDFSVEPIFSVNQYTITFRNEDGTVLQSGLVNCGDIPTYDGQMPYKETTAEHTYTFSGWNPTIVAAREDAVYTARFSAITNGYQITFQNANGETLQSSTVEYGIVPSYVGVTPTKPATAQYTYTFTGWDKTITSVIGTEIYTAQFDSVVNKYTITFVDEDGTVLQTNEVEYGQVPAYNGATPTKPSTGEFTYTFAGWSPEVVAVTAVATYTATYSSTVNSYLITFVNYDGTTLQSGMVNYGVTPIYNGATPTRPATAQYTYTFKGWSPAIASVTDAATYTAQFDSVVNKYTITFADEDGTILQTSEVEYGQMPAYNGTTPTKPSTGEFTYTFAGWSPNVVAVTGNATYTATYTNATNGYLIQFVNYDGSTLQSGVVNYGVTPVYNGATPQKPSTAQYTYTFKGWDKTIVLVVGAETYTAQFDSIVNKYTITFADEDGTILQTSEVAYGQVPAYNGATPTKPSTGEFTYTFAGWSPNVVAVTGNATYTATYTNATNGYLIQFVNYDGATLQSGVVNYGVTPVYHGATPTKPATAQYTFTFKGWDKAIVSVVGAETYTAQFDSVVNKYTITFVNEDGTILQTSEVEYGQMPAYNGTTPTKPSTGEFTYTFAGWTPEVASVTGAATYTATYSSTVNKYTITFVNEDGTILQASEVEYGQVPAYNGVTPSKAATAEYTYTFAGWTPEIVAITGDATYRATYSSVVNQYTITVSGENCTITGGGTYDYGTEITLTVTPDDGYQLVAWSDGNTDSSRQITVTEDATYTAILEKIETGWQENILKEKGKVIFDGHHFYILRGDQLYDAAGRKQN